MVGFDDASRGQGRVDCRVFADDKEIYANPDLRATDPPVKLSLSVARADQLRLQVDYGRGQDTGDRVIWANARLYRPAPPKPKPAPAKAAESKPAAATAPGAKPATETKPAAPAPGTKPAPATTPTPRPAPVTPPATPPAARPAVRLVPAKAKQP